MIPKAKKTQPNSPLRKIAKVWLLVGLLGLSFVAVFAIGIFESGQPVHERSSGGIVPRSEVTGVLGPVAAVFGFFAWCAFVVALETAKIMIPDIDIWRAALLMVKRYGDDAPTEAAIRADKLQEDGDHDGAVTWHRILAAIERLQAKAPAEGEKVH